jgi:purine-nucleoside/S-methyl-5'-thioadenosine phosphorylase / adenosine deaminase
MTGSPELVWRPAPPAAGQTAHAWPPLLVAEDLLARGVVAAFTGRAGGASAPPYASLNLGLRVGDDLRSALANRRRTATVLGLAGLPWAVARQVHSAVVLRAGRDRIGQGPPEAKPPLGEGDGLVTAEPAVVLAVLCADCAPVLLADPAAGVVGVVHAGWRGLAVGVVEAGVAAMAELGADPAATVGLVGPAVGGCCYEVGPEVRDTFVARLGAEGARGFVERDGRLWLDLRESIAAELRDRGVAVVVSVGPCTGCRRDVLHSYRREGKTGRQLSYVGWV